MTEEPTRKQIIEEFHKGAESWNAWIEKCRKDKADGKISWFPKPDFGELNFEGYDFSGYELFKINFSKAKLRDASFRDAELSGCIFDGAELINADMRSRGEGLCSLVNADLTGADFSGSFWQECDFTSAICTDSIFRSAFVTDCKFDNATLTNAMLSGADFTDTSFVDSQLKYAKLKGSKLSGTDFSFADLSFANLEESFCVNANFMDAHLINSVLNGADMEGTTLQNANLSLASIDGTNLRAADLRGIILETETLTAAILDEQTLLDPKREEQLAQVREFIEEIEKDSIGTKSSMQRMRADGVVSVSSSINRDELSDRVLTHQVMQVITPITYNAQTGEKIDIIFEATAIAMRGKQNSIPEFFDDLVANPAKDERISKKNVDTSWLELLTAEWLNPEDKKACFSAIASAMNEKHAAPYFGSLEWLSADNLSVIRDGLEFCKEFGDGNAVVGALQAGASIFIFGIFPVGLYHTHKALGLLTNRLVDADLRRDAKVLVEQAQTKTLTDS